MRVNRDVDAPARLAAHLDLSWREGRHGVGGQGRPDFREGGACGCTQRQQDGGEETVGVAADGLSTSSFIPRPAARPPL